MMYVRLAILGITALVILGLVATTFWYRGESIEAQAEADRAKADLATAIAANKAQEETIGRLRASAEANNRMIAEFLDELAAINEAVTESKRDIGALKDANEVIREYLNTPVPPDLWLRLNE